jgi:hypothetical protein
MAKALDTCQRLKQQPQSLKTQFEDVAAFTRRKKRRNGCHLSDSVSKGSTIHLSNITLPQSNPRSFKHLTTRNNNRNFGTSHAHIWKQKDPRTVTIAARNRKTHSSQYGGITLCGELPSCLQVLSFY